MNEEFDPLCSFEYDKEKEYSTQLREYFAKNNLHFCTPIFPAYLFGQCIDQCWETDDGMLCVDNMEYGTRVNYCPFCGYKAKNQFIPCQ